MNVNEGPQLSHAREHVTQKLLLGAVLAIVAGLLGLYLSGEVAIGWTIAITTLCLVWWVTEPMPIPITSLIPMALFPLVGVLSPADVAKAYGSPITILLLGGFLLSTAMAGSGVHRRIAFMMIRLLGGDSARRIVFGFMVASALLSMWISNTATVLMLLPIALAVVANATKSQLALPLLLGIAFAANVGGIGTPIGTPPNLVFLEVYRQTSGHDIGFLHWMLWGVPVVLLMLPLMALWITRNLGGQTVEHDKDYFHLGAWESVEKRVLIVFALVALGWITRLSPFGGWSSWLDMPNANDSQVALLGVLLMFIIPDGKGSRLLTWEIANRIPWGILLLFAGGFCIALAFKNSGLSAIIGDALGVLTFFPSLLLILVICLCVTFLTEMTSNTATTQILMPILAAAALGASLRPELLMVPAAMSASCAFMLPVATAPNAIVFGTGHIHARTMAREGLLLNFLGAIVITTVCWLLIA